MKALKIILNWVVFLALIAGAWWLFNKWTLRMPDLPHMSGYMVVITAMSMAFVWTDILKIGSVKPFVCHSCMSAWFALILAFLFHTEFWWAYLFVGKFVACLYFFIKSRWL